MHSSTRAVAFAALAIFAFASGRAIASDSRYVRNEPSKTTVIVFVHGVTGDGTSTWTNSQTGAYWPALVAADSAFKRANVYVFEYPSPSVGRSLSVNELAEAMRRRLQSDGVLAYPELIFLSHSMGGLVTRAFLLKNRTDASKVKMAYFFATPTEGSPSAILLSLASKNTQFKNMYPMQSDGYLADLQRDWLSARLGIRSFCAYEGLATFGLQVVDQRSASNLCTEPLDPIAVDHIQIVKPSDTRADQYIAFKNAFELVSRDGGVVPRADRGKTDHPYIEPNIPMNQQVQLFPEDKIKVFGPDSMRRVRVWLGRSWEEITPGQTYMVVGTPGQPITPKFEPMPKSGFKLEVEYDKYVDSPRDLRPARAAGEVLKK